LEEFAEEDEANTLIIDNMLDSFYFSNGDAKQRTLKCYNTAYYICTLIQACDKRPEWNFPLYCDIAYCNDKGNKVYRGFTLALVYIFITKGNSKPLYQKLIKKLYDFFGNLTSHLVLNDPYLQDYSYRDVCKDLLKNTPDDFSISERFARRTIDREAVSEIMMVRETNWPQFLGFFEERRVREIVEALERTEDEGHNVVEIIRQAANGFYTSGHSDYPEKVLKMLERLDAEIHSKYTEDVSREAFEAAMAETDKRADTAPLHARIKELEQENQTLRSQLQTHQEKPEEETDMEQRAGIESRKAALLTRIALSKLGGLPANRENAWPVISSLWGCSESIAKRRLRESVREDTVEALAKVFDGVSPKIVGIIRKEGKEIVEKQKKVKKQ